MWVPRMAIIYPSEYRFGLTDIIPLVILNTNQIVKINLKYLPKQAILGNTRVLCFRVGLSCLKSLLISSQYFVLVR